jgi:hypothetical protein
VTIARIAALAVVLALAGCGGGDTPEAPPRPGPFTGAPVTRDGLTLPARVQGGVLALAERDRFVRRFWPGINLGVTTPGHSPGELAPTRADYDRWLAGIGRLGARVVRVYTILRPAFYDALAAYNERHRAAPLHFIQGVWIPEEEFLAAQDAYAPAVTRGFDAEIADAVAVVHGDADLPARPGHASGRYRADVARWLLAWSPGIEWDPEATLGTDHRHPGTPPYRGRYIAATAAASPMESWIAARLDHLAALEAARGWSRPVTFTNWLTADPLHHPAEPLANEDAVSVDAMHLRATAAWPGGFFASYHAYPYFPDFLRLEPRYRHARDPYAAYLRDLRAHHRGQAVMITEFGVPTGIGVAHRGPLGRDQGDHSEREAGAIDAAMLRDIRAAGYAGGVLFEWTDEWFKRTWNTQDQELPEDRRQLWQNALNNEEQFGIVASEPRAPVAIDGRTDEWRRNGSRAVGELRVTHDPAWLYLLVPKAPDARRALDFDVRPGGGPDVRLVLGPGRRAQILERRGGRWASPRLTIVRRPAEYADVGRLRWGPAAQDGRNTVDGDDTAVEVRIPWALLGFGDPSSQTVWKHGGGTEKVGAIQIDGEGAYDWADWTAVRWRERRKAGWDAVAGAFAAASR